MSQTYEITQFPTYIYTHVKAAFSLKHDVDNCIQDLVTILEASEKPLFLFVHIDGVSWGLDEFAVVLSNIARGSNAFLHHHNMRELLIITQSKFVELGARGLNSPIFGNVPVKTFPTDAAALAYINR